MKKREKSSFGWGRSSKPNKGSATNPLKKEKFNIYNFVVASVLILGLGVCFSGQALADGGGGSPPVIAAKVTGTRGSNGWYKSNVSVAWTFTSSGSAITNKSGCGPASVTTDTAGVTFTCSATNRYGTASRSVTIKRDTVPPKATITTPTNGATYTQNKAVAASYSCTDATAGVAACVGTVARGANIDTSTSGTKTFKVTATDRAGNATNKSINYTVSGSPVGGAPVVTPTVTGTQGTNGWYKSNVGVTWAVSDPAATKTGCDNVSLTTDTAGVTYTCKATNSAGTTTKSVTVKRDATPPSATVVSPPNGATYTQNQAVKASYSCTDATAGVAACTGTVANGANLDTSSAGAKTFSVNASDQAGNTTNKLINYTVSGSPVVGAPVVTPTVTGTQGTNGWYTGNVGVTWTVSDPAATKSAGCSNVSLTTDTAGVTYTCTATNSTGATTKSVTIKRDAAPPSTTIVAPISGATYTQNQAVKASYTCTDSTAGVAACTGTIASGANLDTSTAGTKSFSVTASDQAGNTTNKSISYTVGVVSANGTHLFAWNDLGMHCADSDFSIFTLLPPFNDLNAQLVVNGKLIDATTNSAYKLTYQSTPDPTGSVNSFSESKTNFWTYDQPLFGTDLAPNIGLTGNPTPSYTPAPLAWDATYNWFEASGIPIIPIDDNLNANYFPMVRVTALDSTGKAVASSDTVLPVSSEINCGTCHASVTGSAAAKPTAGWVNPTPTNTEQDWRLNILRLHDQKNVGANYTALLTQKGYGASLETSARVNGKPVLCDSCHNSNALAVWGIKGMPGAVSNMTAAMHNRHANVTLPGASQTLNSIATRDSCYNCHPGQKTECLRGAMGNAVDATGKHTMECQACHGSMTTVGNNAREGWFDMPTCQSCHHDGIRETVAINPNGTFKTWADTRFASNVDTPAKGWTLYRYSKGHSNLQCEACHNSTHAEFTDKPSANGNQVNDNLSAVKAQGYAAAIRECTVCHTTMPSTVTGGPHGLHTIGQAWVSGHQGASKTGCTYCHGTTSAGSPLAVVKVQKTLNGRIFAANTRITCWSCHNGPNPD